MDRLRTIVTEVYKAINDMSPEFLQDLFVIKANIHDLRDNNKMKLYKFKTMTYGNHSINYVAGILWNSINVDIKNTDNVNVLKRKINLTLLHLSSVYISYFHWCLLHFSYCHTSWTKSTCACVNCFYCLPCKIKMSYCLSYCLILKQW